MVNQVEVLLSANLDHYLQALTSMEAWSEKKETQFLVVNYLKNKTF